MSTLIRIPGQKQALPKPVYGQAKNVFRAGASAETVEQTNASDVPALLAHFGHDFSRLPVNAPPVAAGSCPITLASPRACPFGGACHTCPARVQAKLAVSQPGDIYEQEADRLAQVITRMTETPVMQRKCVRCSDDEDEELQRKKASGQAPVSELQPEALAGVHNALQSAGQPLNAKSLAFMEPRFGRDFHQVRVHTDSKAAESAAMVGARAYTLGRNMVFGAGQYEPETQDGQELLAHELVHVVQQSSGSLRQESLQRAVLTSPRLVGNRLFNDLVNNREVLENGDTGPEVRRIQQLLIDLGYDLSGHGADGIFGSETKAAVREYQTDKGLTMIDGRVGWETIGALDADFPPFALPANRNAPWTMPCVLGILCPWNRNLVENVLPGFNIITFDTRTFPTETWNGSTWVPGTFHSGGFRSGTNMGFLNTTRCQDFASTVYHEGWHAQQPAAMTGVVEVERDAYVNSEQWMMSLGIPGVVFTNAATGNPEDLRTTSSTGETIVDVPAAERMVRQEYGGVSSIPGERILRRVGPRNVRVRRPDGSEYERPAAVNESVRGPVTMTNQHPIDPADWDCTGIP